MTASKPDSPSSSSAWPDLAERIWAQAEAGDFHQAALGTSRLAGDAVLAGHFDIAHAAYRLRHELIELGTSAESAHEHWSVLMLLIQVVTVRQNEA